MKEKLIEIFSERTNSSIVKMPERNFPGVVIQGDSLSIMYSSALHLLEVLEGKIDKESYLELLDHAETLEGHLLNYEKTLNDHSIELPYVRNPKENTKKYQHYWNEEK